MEIEGYIYYSGKGYDDDGHTDDYDLMFVRCDNGEEICLNGFEQALFPKCYNATSGISPMSVHDNMRGKLTIKFEQSDIEQGVIV
jgi:hypothetical protein